MVDTTCNQPSPILNLFNFICEKIKRKNPITNNKSPRYLIQSGIFILIRSAKHIWNHENHRINMTMYTQITTILFSAHGDLLYVNILNTVRIMKHTKQIPNQTKNLFLSVYNIFLIQFLRSMSRFAVYPTIQLGWKMNIKLASVVSLLLLFLCILMFSPTKNSRMHNSHYEALGCL